MAEDSSGNKKPTEPRTRPTVSTVTPRGELVELLYDKEKGRTSFSVGKAGTWEEVPAFPISTHERLVPYSPKNNLIAGDVVLFPSRPEDYGTKEELVREIRAFIHRYVDVSPRFEQVASYYVLLSWVYDRFSELPYLRLRGEYGSGKTRFLVTVGSLCYHPIFASGASTIAPIFHILDRFHGTLIIDEADFRLSDDKADVVKILNTGNVRGVKILRMEANAAGEYNPRAFEVFGPKIVATHGFYEDRALESRFITEVMTARSIRADIPINLDDAHKAEAAKLRNKLLCFRFENYDKVGPVPDVLGGHLEPRIRQILGPLAAIIGRGPLLDDLKALAAEYQQDLVAERGMQPEARVLEVLRDCFAKPGTTVLPIQNIVEVLATRFEEEFGKHVTNRWVGSLLRRTLHIRTQKSHGIFVVPFTERATIAALCQRYGLSPLPKDEERVDSGDPGDVDEDAAKK